MNLIETNSLTYKRRLVRELNKLVDGFYAYAPEVTKRCTRAKLIKGFIMVRCLAMEKNVLYRWFTPVREHFVDAQGRTVVASRQP